MPVELQKKEETSLASLSFLHELLANHRPRDFTIRLWDGATLLLRPADRPLWPGHQSSRGVT